MQVSHRPPSGFPALVLPHPHPATPSGVPGASSAYGLSLPGMGGERFVDFGHATDVPDRRGHACLSEDAGSLQWRNCTSQNSERNDAPASPPFSP